MHAAVQHVETISGRLYGLGTLDMQGGIASIMGVVQALHATNTTLRNGLTFSLATQVLVQVALTLLS